MRLRSVESWEEASSSLVSSIAPNMNLGVGYKRWGRGWGKSGAGGGVGVEQGWGRGGVRDKGCRVLQTILSNGFIQSYTEYQLWTKRY